MIKTRTKTSIVSTIIQIQMNYFWQWQRGGLIIHSICAPRTEYTWFWIHKAESPGLKAMFNLYANWMWILFHRWKFTDNLCVQFSLTDLWGNEIHFLTLMNYWFLHNSCRHRFIKIKLNGKYWEFSSRVKHFQFRSWTRCLKTRVKNETAELKRMIWSILASFIVPDQMFTNSKPNSFISTNHFLLNPANCWSRAHYFL